MHRKVIQARTMCWMFHIFLILYMNYVLDVSHFLFSEAARDVRPVREELLPPKPIKAARKRRPLIQETQRIETPFTRLCSKRHFSSS